MPEYQVTAEIVFSIEAPDEYSAKTWVHDNVELTGPTGVTRGIDEIDITGVEPV